MSTKQAINIHGVLVRCAVWRPSCATRRARPRGARAPWPAGAARAGRRGAPPPGCARPGCPPCPRAAPARAPGGLWGPCPCPPGG